MKKELDPKIVALIIGAAVLVLGVGGYMAYKGPGGVPPSEDVSQVADAYANDLKNRSGGGDPNSGGGMSEEQMRQQSPGGTR
ncbi:MAG: hypothetical protein J0L72_10085 [Armatimonadetes bacterium]|nr:hypothetical protein [Armatimonadota bacterium]